VALVKSISGFRGTIGGVPGSALTPLDLIKITTAYAQQVLQSVGQSFAKVVVGRDARLSGDMVNRLVCGTLLGCGIDVVDAGLASTPTVAMAVVWEGADGGIVLTASHNPREWNALKLFNRSGEFLSAQESAQVVAMAEGMAESTAEGMAEGMAESMEREAFCFPPVDRLGRYSQKEFTQSHIDAVIGHPLVDVTAIYSSGFKVAIDAVNSVGGIIVPKLLENLGVTCVPLHCEPTGNFAHNPEPLPEHLQELSQCVVNEKCDLGFAVDPDVDRLAIVCEDGSMFGEEYTLVAVADYVLGLRKGSVVSNLSSSRALTDVAAQHGCIRYVSAVGEVNVVEEMKLRQAVVGGEGNGGVIVPDLHYGRDAIIGIALFLTYLAHQHTPFSAQQHTPFSAQQHTQFSVQQHTQFSVQQQSTCSQLKARYPQYAMVKERIEVAKDVDINSLFTQIKEHYKNQSISEIDGIKVEFEAEKKWVILRASNTEPILRVYAEAETPEKAHALAFELLEMCAKSDCH